jgi:hypothetical protein
VRLQAQPPARPGPRSLEDNKSVLPIVREDTRADADALGVIAELIMKFREFTDTDVDEIRLGAVRISEESSEDYSRSRFVAHS